MRGTKKTLTNIKLDAKKHREKFLQQKEDKKGSMKYSRYLRMFIFYRNTIETHSTIKRFKTNSQNNITYIDIPK